MAFNDVDETSEAQISARLVDEVRHLHSLWGQGPPKRPFSAENNSEKSDGRNKRFKKDRSQSDEETAAVSKNKSGWNMKLNVERSKRSEDSKKRKNEETALLSDIQQRKPHVTKSEWKIDVKVEWPERFQKNKKQKTEETGSTSYIEKKKPNASNLEWKMEEHLETADGASNLRKEDRVMKFFVEMFEKDAELRSYYEENCNSTSFECFVCSAICQRIGKRYPNCASLIQHALELRKTKRIASHRGYGRALSAMLSLNAKGLPNSKSSTNPRVCIPHPHNKGGMEEGTRN